MRQRPDRTVARLLAAALLATSGSAVVLLGLSPRGKLTQVAASDRGNLREWDGRVRGMERARELRLRVTEQDTLLPSRQHDRLDQYYRGVRVFGADLVRESDGPLTVRLAGNLYTGIDLDPAPSLTSAEAVAIAERLAGGSRLKSAAPELVILPREAGGFRLAWLVSVLARDGLPVLFVDARTGAEILRYDNLKTQTGSVAVGLGHGVLGDEKKMSVALSAGRYVAMDLQRPWAIWTFDLKGNLARTMDAANGDIALVESDRASDADNVWDDGVVVDAHTYPGWTLDYLYKRFNRTGIGGAVRTSPLEVIVHPVRRADLTTLPWADAGIFFLNAFYCGGCGAFGYDIFMFGEGLPPGYVDGGGQYVDFYAGSLDIVAHELAHGVTDYSANLVYMNESGALSEAFSDIIGMSAEAYLQPPGSGPWTADYLVGEDNYRPGRPGTTFGLRSSANPGLFGDPDHYSKRYTGTGDRGGVHTNCTIVSHAFYLAIEGGTNRTSGLSVQGVGASNREQIEKVFYRAFTYLITSTATFSQARAAVIQAARDLYGAGGAVERAVTDAWTAVGVS